MAAGLNNHMSEFKNLHIVDHPLVQHKLSHMRDKNCPDSQFRTLLREIAHLMSYEVLKDMEIETREIETPMQKMDAPFLKKPLPVIVPILRAGLGMSDGVLDMIPEATTGHIGVYRDHDTHQPVEYLVKLPEVAGRHFILVDPMLATGGSAKFALDVMVKHGVDPKKMSFMVLVAAPEGVKVIADAYPDLPIYTAALDEKLNENAYILPGLGDAGDRIFGTHE
jgi:uracil phosphoribosyltransferase